MSKILAALLLAACGAAQALTITYQWTIDWDTSQDESATFDYQVRGELDAPFRPFKSPQIPQGEIFYEWYPELWALVRNCTGFPCSGGEYIYGGGYTQALFSEGANHQASRATFDQQSGCQESRLTRAECYKIESGTTSLVDITAQVPEPETYALMLLGLALIAVGGRRRISKSGIDLP